MMDKNIVRDYGKLEGHRYHPREIAGFAYDAGFRLRKLVMAVQIALAESAGYDQAKHFYDNAEGDHIYVDRGMWQLHSKWHAEVTDQCAYNPACAAKAVYKITDGGTSWKQWASFTNESYKSLRMMAARGVINFYWQRFHQKVPYFKQFTR